MSRDKSGALYRLKTPVTCQFCGAMFRPFNKEQKYCNLNCWKQASVGENNPMWQGGRYALGTGYIMRNIGSKQIQFEHRLIVEKALGHPLPPNAVVHHWDGNPSNNDPSNLVICENQTYHKLLHARADRLRDTGSLDLKRCYICKEVKPIAAFNRKKDQWDGRQRGCRVCTQAEGREQKAKRKARLLNSGNVDNVFAFD